MSDRNLMQRMLRHLQGRRHLYVPTTMTLAPLDPVEIRNERELERRGQEHGARNQPAADSKTLDDVESEVVTLVEQQREVAGHYLHDNLSTYAERLNSLDLDSAATDIGVEARKVLSDFTTELSHGADRVYAARQEVVELDQHMRNFRRRAKLDRPAHFPSSHILHFGILLTLLVVEVALNGVFLGETSLLGLLGGFVEATVIAIVNVGLGAVVGYGVLRQCWHRSIFLKLVGVLGLVLYLAIAVGFNLAVAHYRDALSAGAWETAATQALKTLVTNPIGVADIKSWMLFLLGFFFSLIALVDGFRMDDPYPGYGPRARRLARTQQKYSYVKAGCLEDLSEIKNEAVEAMVATKRELGTAQGEYRSILEARQRLVEQYKNHLKGLEEVENNLLASYRASNRAHRTQSAPKRFDERSQMQMPAVPVFGELDLRKMDTAVQRANEVLERKIEEVHSEYDKAIRAFQRIEELSEEELVRGSAQAIVKAA